MANEKFCLRWNDFEQNINNAFKELRDERDFFDITLACDDEQIQAHKVILSACSPFFKSILRRNPHQHPLLYLHGVSFTDLQSVLNFMYHGEVSVAQEELNSFLAVAENLKVKGLTQQNNSESKLKQSPLIPLATAKPPVKASFEAQKPTLPTPTSANNSRFIKTGVEEDEIQEVVPIKSEPRDFPPPISSAPSDQPLYSQHQQNNSLVTADDQTLDYTEDGYDVYEEYPDQVMDGAAHFNTGGFGNAAGQTFQDPSELMQFVEQDKEDISRRRYVCNICNNFYHQSKSNVRNHVECKHFPDSFVYNCELCGNSLPSKAALHKHKHKAHRPIQ